MIAEPSRLPAVQRIGDIPGVWAHVRAGDAALVDARATFTWSELEAARRDWSERLARSLGVRPGDRVMVLGENGPPMALMLYAVPSAGAWIVNVNARLAAREVDAIREHAQPRRVLYLLEDSADARAHAQRHGASPVDGGRWGAMAVSPLGDVAAEATSGDPREDVAALIYTTGTTGDPKGVMLTHANLLFIARNSGALRRIVPGERVYGLLPLSHVYGMASVCLGSMLAGGSVHLQSRFQPAAAAAFLREQRITVCQGVPAMYAKLVEHLKGEGMTRMDAPSLRFLYAGGSPLDAALKREVEAFFGLTLHNGYGLTEASPTLTQTRQEAPRADCSVGPAIPGVELRIVDRAGRDLPPNEVGELWARGPNVMKGYYRNPAATAAAIQPGGWLATGDLARIAPDGAVHIEGRLKELIIRGGFNVFPVEVEAVLAAHPEVTQAAVVGRRVAGDEEVVAFVELVPGARVDGAGLLEFAARALAPYKRPCEVVVLPQLPAAPSGKVLKARLAAMAASRARAT